MTEHISLELAKRIAEKYRVLGVEAPTSKYAWFEDSFDRPYLDLNPGNGDDFIAHSPTAAELFSALPPVVGVEKVYTVFNAGKITAHYRAYIRKNNGESAQVESDNPTEALGKMWLRVLDEMRREKTNQGGAR
jgi:hypothetical protein